MDVQKQEITRLVGERIKSLRLVRSFSQEDLALRASLNPAYFGQVERGTKCPTIDTLYKISKALEIPLWELLRLETLSVQNGCRSVGGHMEQSAQMNEWLSCLPAEKQKQVLEIFEKIIQLL